MCSILFDLCEKCNNNSFVFCMYRLPCFHYVCVNCVNKGVYVCNKCDEVYRVKIIKVPIMHPNIHYSRDFTIYTDTKFIIEKI
jgi:hypothetical protein